MIKLKNKIENANYFGGGPEARLMRARLVN